MTLVELLRLDYCSCHEGFTCRGLTDPSCESCSTKDERNEAADLIESQAKRIAELEETCISHAQIQNALRDELAALRQKIEDAPVVAYESSVSGDLTRKCYEDSDIELIRKEDLK